MKRRKHKNRHELERIKAATEIIKLMAAIIALLTAFLNYLISLIKE